MYYIYSRRVGFLSLVIMLHQSHPFGADSKSETTPSDFFRLDSLSSISKKWSLQKKRFTANDYSYAHFIVLIHQVLTMV